MSNKGKKVAVHYTGTLDDGSVFDSSRTRNQPLEFTCMAGQMIAGFDAAVEKMAVGDIVDVHIPAAEAYGEYRDDLVQTIPFDALPGSEKLEEGAHIVLTAPTGQPFPAVVKAKDDKNITLDMNHDLAGQDLNFNIELLSVED